MRALSDDLWVHEGSVRFYGFRIQTRMTVARLSDGRLWLHSPTPLDDATRRTVSGLGRVSFLVSPNKIHHQALGAWAAAFPRAALYASPGLPERRPDLRFDAVLGDRPEPPWAEALDQAATGGNCFFSEILFLHRASRSLVVADLVENLDPSTASRAGRLAARLFGVGSRPVASPEFRFYTLDAEAARRSLERVRAWDFERIVLAHGAIIERDARAVFEGVCNDLLTTAGRRSRPARTLLRGLARLQ